MKKEHNGYDAVFYRCQQIPVVGQKIYVNGAMYMSHGEDDFAGGIATISKIEESSSGGEPCLMVSISERPGHSYNWTFLEEKQQELQKKFGDDIAHADPDDRLEFNSWASPGDTVTTTKICPRTGKTITTKRVATRYEP